MDLESIYRDTLRRCAPDLLVREVVRPEMPRHVVAIGKCAAPLLDGVAAVLPVDSTLVIVPHGYPAPAGALRGGHPEMDAGSFEAGEALIRYVDAHDEILFLISGGGSACVEAPLPGWFTARDLIEVNTRLISAGLPIAEINAVRKHLSAIKGGRLAARVKGRSVTLLYSDVATGDLSAVASGPTVPDNTTKSAAASTLERLGGCDGIVNALRDESLPETITHIPNATASVIADNHTLAQAAADVARARGITPILIARQMEEDVEAAAVMLARKARELREGQILIAGGEPTVVMRGAGRGGRCSELAVRFALHYRGGTVHALFGSSDGVDGTSGAAGIVFGLPMRIDAGSAAAALARSDSYDAATKFGRPIIIPPTGNNLRDLYLVARG